MADCKTTRKNTLRMYKLVQELTQKHYEEGVTTYKGIFDKYIKPVYPMHYQTYIKIINTPVKREDLED